MPELHDWVLALAGSPWILLVLFAATTVDGFFPPVPSESVVITLAALSLVGGAPSPWLVGVVAAAGAFAGDGIAYSIGRRIPVRSVRLLSSPRAQRAVTGAESALERRGAALLIGARFLPVGRVAVTMTAGSLGYPRRRFTVLAAVAAVLWAAYSVALGIGAAHLLGDRHPLVAVALGLLAGLVIGAVVDRVLSRPRPGARRGPARTTGLRSAPARASDAPHVTHPHPTVPEGAP